jgi:hypothetical protein
MGDIDTKRLFIWKFGDEDGGNTLDAIDKLIKLNLITEIEESRFIKLFRSSKRKMGCSTYHLVIELLYNKIKAFEDSKG